MNAKKSLGLPGLRMFRQSGVSLVEILVALVLSLVLLAGVGQIYLGSKQTYRVQDGQSRLQENGRYALELLTKDIREVGYQGCRQIGTPTPPKVIANAALGNTLGNKFAQDTVIKGDERPTTGGWNPTNPNPVLPDTVKDTVMTGTDVVAIQFASSCGGAPISATTTTSVTIPATNTCSLGVGDTLLLSDCQSVDVFRADTATATTVTVTGANNSQGNLSKAYSALTAAELMRFNSYTYFIRLGASGEEPALWRLDNTSAVGGDNPAELVEGIENMQILYGVDTDADRVPNQFVTADAVPDWTQVVSVRVTLTARSVGEKGSDNLTSAQNAPRFYDGNANYVDRRLLRNFSATISLRNRTQ